MRTHISRVLRFGAVTALSLASMGVTSVVAMAAPVANTSDVATVVVQGTVKALTSSSSLATSLTLQPFDLSRPTENIPLSTATLYVKAGATVTEAALVVGESVRVTLGGTPATAVTVQILLPHPVILAGTVTSFTPTTGTPASLEIQPRDSAAAATTVALNAGTIYYLGTHLASLTAISVGSQVRVLASGSPLSADVIYVAVPRRVTMEGTVTGLSPAAGIPTSFTLRPAGHRRLAVNVLLSPSTTYRQGGASVTLTDLLVGSRVRVTTSGSPVTAIAVIIAVPRPVTIVGTVTALTPALGTPTAMTVQPVGVWKAPVVVDLSPTTTYTQLRTSATWSNLLVGSRVVVRATGTPLSAADVRITAPAADFNVGSVIAVTSSSLSIQPITAGAAPVNYALTSSTMYFSGRRQAGLAAVNVGDLVRVGANAAAPGVALIVTVRNMVIIGRVRSVAGGVITVTGLYGATLTIDVTTSTQFRMDGHASSVSAVVPGVIISAIGPAISGVTTSVSASMVWIGHRHNDILHDAWTQFLERAERHHH